MKNTVKYVKWLVNNSFKKNIKKDTLILDQRFIPPTASFF